MYMYVISGVIPENHVFLCKTLLSRRAHPYVVATLRIKFILYLNYSYAELPSCRDYNFLTFKGWKSYKIMKNHYYITYIIGHYNPSVRIIDLVSHTIYVVCVNFIHKWRDLQFKVDSERQIFWETFHGNFIYSRSFCQKSAERKSPKKYFSYFV